MACSAIYTGNENIVVAANGQVPFGNIHRRFGCNCDLNGNGIICRGRGYYDVFLNLSITPEADGLLGVQLYADGAPVPNAVAYFTGAAATTETVAFPAIVRVIPCDGAVSLSVGLISPEPATTGATVNNFGAVVRKA